MCGFGSCRQRKKWSHCGDSERGRGPRWVESGRVPPVVLPCKQHPTFSGAFTCVTITPGTEWYFLAFKQLLHSLNLATRLLTLLIPSSKGAEVQEIQEPCMRLRCGQAVGSCIYPDLRMGALSVMAQLHRKHCDILIVHSYV